ncbi:MAG: NlpC/P60 family protein [Verrucomicrobiaceae bacterium]
MCVAASVSFVFAETKSLKKTEGKKSEVKQSEVKKPRVKDEDAPTPDKEATPSSKAGSDSKQNDGGQEVAGNSPNATIATEELLEFQTQPAAVKKLIEAGLELARKNLTYTFGSADPAKGGMDCSGFIYYMLRQHGFTQVPRDSSGQYVWVRRSKGFRAVVSRKADSFEMDELLPGDLLFWTGTYDTNHDPPISHVMIYLGTEKSTGSKVMIGSSDGRTYHGQKRNGVSVFDFVMPLESKSGTQQSTFVGYGRIPGLRE